MEQVTVALGFFFPFFFFPLLYWEAAPRDVLLRVLLRVLLLVPGTAPSWIQGEQEVLGARWDRCPEGPEGSLGVIPEVWEFS